MSRPSRLKSTNGTPFLCVPHLRIDRVSSGVQPHRSGRSHGFVLSILILLAYYISLSASEVMALKKEIPPFGRWTPNLLFGGLASTCWSDRQGISIQTFDWLNDGLDAVQRKWRTSSTMLRSGSPSVCHSEYLKIFGLPWKSDLHLCVVLFFQKLDTITKHQAPFYLIFEYLLYKYRGDLPMDFALWGIALNPSHPRNFSRHSEITAMKAGGVSLYRSPCPHLPRPDLQLLLLSRNEYLVPVTNQRTRHLLSVQVRKEQPSSSFKNYKIWFHADHRIYNIQLSTGNKGSKGIHAL